MEATTVTRSASGARQAGDDFQHLVAWNNVLRALRDRRQLVRVGIEDPDAGNVDDVTIEYEDDAGHYSQIKYSVDARNPINLAYLLAVANSSSGRATSILQKLYASWVRLSADTAPILQIITNKLVDHTDEVLSRIDSRTNRLDEALRSRPTDLAAIAEHLQVGDEGTLRFFGAVEFHVGVSFDQQMQLAAASMDGRGLRCEEADIRLGIDRMRRYVIDGVRELDRERLLADIAELRLEVRSPSPALAVQAIDWDPAASEADEVLDWVGLYEGDEARTRRQPTDPGSYHATMQPELNAAAARILASSPELVRVRGPMRLPAWFAVGAALPRVRGVELEIQQRGGPWSTAAEPDRAHATDATLEVVDGGLAGDLAVVLAITNDPSADVARYLAGSSLSIRAVLTVRIAAGPSDTSVEGAGHAAAIAQEVVSSTRAATAEVAAAAVHLFAAAPSGMMLFLGHRWNRIVTTTTYEDLGAQGYLPAFVVDG